MPFTSPNLLLPLVSRLNISVRISCDERRPGIANLPGRTSLCKGKSIRLRVAPPRRHLADFGKAPPRCSSPVSMVCYALAHSPYSRRGRDRNHYVLRSRQGPCCWAVPCGRHPRPAQGRHSLVPPHSTPTTKARAPGASSSHTSSLPVHVAGARETIQSITTSLPPPLMHVVAAGPTAEEAIRRLAEV
jgi:hypothetical protein